MTETTYAVGARAKGSKKAPRVGLLNGKRVIWHDSDREGYDGSLTAEQINRYVKPWAARNKRTLVLRPIDRYPHVYGDRDCNANLLAALERTGKILSRQKGRKIRIRIRSGRRTMAEQTALYNQNMQSPGVPKPGRPLTAYPNANAPHTQGIAADCEIEGLDIGDFPGAIAALDRAGACLPVRTEDWHVQLGENFAGANS